MSTFSCGVVCMKEMEELHEGRKINRIPSDVGKGTSVLSSKCYRLMVGAIWRRLAPWYILESLGEYDVMPLSHSLLERSNFCKLIS